MPELLTTGVSHKTAPLTVRERVALPPNRAAQLVADLNEQLEIVSTIVVSTCNRTELYALTADPEAAEITMRGRLAQLAGETPEAIGPNLYSLRGRDVAEHLMRVAGGLDSMVVGETEILGQVKRAHARALENGGSGPVLNRLFAAAVTAGKRVHDETSIGSGKVSVASTAVATAAESLGGLTDRRALVIGSGAHGENTARALADAGVASVFVANRRLDRARSVAHRFGGRAVDFDEMPAELVETDIVIGATGSPHTVIHADELRAVMQQRPGRPLLIIDTAVPRDIEAAAGDVEGVTLLDLDDLQHSIGATIALREGESEIASEIVTDEADRFMAWFDKLDILPTIAEMRKRGDAIADQVLAENARHLTELSEEQRERVEAMAHAIVSRMLHEPTMRLKESKQPDANTRQ
jgi:glutamyl-tRNA reductase